MVAKWNNVKVNTFSIGFGKKLIRYRRGETEYCISAIPFGGYVAMSGENPDTLEEGEVPDERDFVAKSVGARAAIAFAGPFINIVFAFALLMVLYMVGVQEPATNELIVGFVAKDSPAAAAGIQPGDTIFEINGEHISRYEEVVRIIDGSKGETVNVTVIRNGDTLTKPLTPAYNEEYKRYMVGIQMGYVLFRETKIVRRGPVEAFTKTCATSWKMTTSIFRYFKRMFQGQVKVDAFSGPVSIVAVMGNVWMSGFQDFLMLLALISINLGVMNLLPLAITDGGLLMFLGIEKLRGKPLSTKTQSIIQNVAAAFFISFFVFITILDFGKLSLFLK